MKKSNKNYYRDLINKGEALPYKQIAIKFSKYLLDTKQSKSSFTNKSIKDGLTKFGEYLEEKKAIMPLKIDVIDFVLKNHDKDGRTLQWYFGVSMEFVLFCHANSKELFDGALKNFKASRHVEFKSDVLIIKDETVFKETTEDVSDE